MADCVNVLIKTPAPLQTWTDPTGIKHQAHDDDGYVWFEFAEAWDGKEDPNVQALVEWLVDNNCPYQLFQSGCFDLLPVLDWWFGPDDHGTANTIDGLIAITGTEYEEGLADWYLHQPERWETVCDSWTSPTNFDSNPISIDGRSSAG